MGNQSSAEVQAAQALHTVFNSPWEYRPNGSDNGLDACFCLKGEAREYGQIDILGDPDIAAHVLRAVNSHADLLAALQLVRNFYTLPASQRASHPTDILAAVESAIQKAEVQS